MPKPQSSQGIVDVHAHVITPSYQALLVELGAKIPGYGGSAGAKAAAAPPPAITDDDAAIAQRITMMDEAGVARQVLSTPFAPYLESAEAASKAARHINDIHHRIVKSRPDRFSAFAALPLPHVDASLSELRRGMDELGMAGVGIQCFCLDQSVADDRFLPIYEELNRRKAVLFFHPCVNGICSPHVTEWGLNATAGTVFEDTVVALHLIIKRIPHQFPDIRIVIPHLGGALAMLLDRLDNQLGIGLPTPLPEKPSATARRFWYDTVGHGSKAACVCAIEAFGATQIVPGSDYPVLLPFESYAQTINYVRQIGLPEETVRRILFDNARDLLGELT